MTDRPHLPDVVPLVRLVREKVDDSNRGLRPFAKERGISYSTLRYYYEEVHGPLRQVPRDATLAALASALRVPLDTVRQAAIDSLAGRYDPESPEPTSEPPSRDGALSIEEAILADDSLIPEAKQHLLNQVGLLRRIVAAAPGVTSLDARRVEDAMDRRLAEIDAVTPTEPPAGPARPAERRRSPADRRRGNR